MRTRPDAREHKIRGRRRIRNAHRFELLAEALAIPHDHFPVSPHVLLVANGFERTCQSRSVYGKSGVSALHHFRNSRIGEEKPSALEKVRLTIRLGYFLIQGSMVRPEKS